MTHQWRGVIEEYGPYLDLMPDGLEAVTLREGGTPLVPALHLSERTVAHHVSAVLGKLGASNRLAAVEQARAKGLLPQDRHSGAQT